MWLCVFFVASLLDLDLTIAGDDAVARISQVNIGVLALVYGYVGSIGAEAFIRYWDEISWNKFPRPNQMFIGSKKFSLGRLCFCFSMTIAYLAIILYTEATNFEAISLRFTATHLTDLPYDTKFILVVLIGAIFRAYIYYNPPSPVGQR